MKSLAVFASCSVGAAWILWELRAPGYRHFVETSYDRPYLVFAFESAMALAIVSVLLFAVVSLQRGLRETIVPWSSNKLVRVQMAVAASAAVTGVYGARHIFQMNSMVGGEWLGGQVFWYTLGPTVAVALSPWIVFIASAVVSVTAAKVKGPVSAAILLFDALSIAYVAFVFVNLGQWACLTCSGPAL